MTRRTRFVSAMIALIAMTSSLVEGVGASMCAPGTAMGTAMASADEAMADMPSNHDCTDGHGDVENHGHQGGAHCPFGPTGMLQGCAAAASLPAARDKMTPSSSPGRALSPTLETTPHLTWVASIFHPPKV